MTALLFDMKYPDNEGHVWRSLAGLADDIAAMLQAEGIDTFLAYPRITGERPYDLQHANVIELDMSSAEPGPVKQLQELIQQNDVRLVSFFDIDASDARVQRVRSLGCRTLNQVRWSFENNPQHSHVKRTVNRLRRWMDIRHHDLYICNGDAQQVWLQRYSSVPHHKMITINTSYDALCFNPENARVECQKLALPEADIKIASVAQCRPEKRIQWMFDVLTDLKQRYPDKQVHWAHAGLGPEFEQLELKRANDVYSDSITLLGYMKSPVGLYGWAHMLAHAAERESFGRVLVESMGCACPVVATRSQGPSTIINHGVTGLLVDLNDKAGFSQSIIRLIEDTDLRSQMGQNAQSDVSSRYDQLKEVKHYMKCYMGLLA